MVYANEERARTVARELSTFGTVAIAYLTAHGWTVAQLPYAGHWHSDRIA